jgi:methyl-accepting chemotaxis protein
MNNPQTRLAVVEEQIKGLREQQKAHATETKYMFANLSAEIKELTEIMNKGRGAFTFALMLSGSMGAMATHLVTFLMEKMR